MVQKTAVRLRDRCHIGSHRHLSNLRGKPYSLAPCRYVTFFNVRRRVSCEPNTLLTCHSKRHMFGIPTGEHNRQRRWMANARSRKSLKKTFLFFSSSSSYRRVNTPTTPTQAYSPPHPPHPKSRWARL